MQKQKEVMSIFNTVDVLKKYGFVDNDRCDDTNEVCNWKYDDDYLEMKASYSNTLDSWLIKDVRNNFIEDGKSCISISGSYNNKNTYKSFRFGMPGTFETEKSCLLWYYVSINFVLDDDWEEYRCYKKPPVQITMHDLIEMLHEKFQSYHPFF